MNAQILDGKALSQHVRGELKERVSRLVEAGITPRLEAIVASQDPASLAYVKMKRTWAEKAGMISGQWSAGPETTQDELLTKIAELNADPDVHGVLLQHPLPKHLDEDAALIALGPVKDADGITSQSLGLLTAGLPGFRCATPGGIMRLLDHYKIQIEGKHDSWEADGLDVARKERDGHHCPLQDSESPRSVSPSRYLGCRRGASGDGKRRLDQTRRGRD
jgi:methylenetetrahydrofolate dehydrogenase (NADP+)/methenyltetrahydrofolate cyclohydrolase